MSGRSKRKAPDARLSSRRPPARDRESRPQRQGTLPWRRMAPALPELSDPAGPALPGPLFGLSGGSVGEGYSAAFSGRFSLGKPVFFPFLPLLFVLPLLMLVRHRENSPGLPRRWARLGRAARRQSAAPFAAVGAGGCGPDPLCSGGYTALGSDFGYDRPADGGGRRAELSSLGV